MRHLESQLQINCVYWFRLQYPMYVCAAIPNGGIRNKVTASIMKAEGVLSGFADLVIIAEQKILFVEMKARNGKQQPAQKDFQSDVERLGFKYIICRSFDEFKTEIENYLNA